MATEFQFLEGEEEAGAPTTLRYRAPASTAPQDPLGSGLTPPIDLAPRRRPEPVQPPAEMRAYEPTWREQLSAGAQAELEGLGMERARARRTAQTVLGGPQSNLPLGAGLIDIPLLPSTPLFMQEGYRGTERAAGALERGDYGGAAMEYLGAVGMMAPGGVLVAKGAPATFRAMGESMGANAPRMGGFSQSQRGIFAGPGAKTADLQALARAEAAELEGRDAQQVWQDTGWFRGADGKWRFEIDDSKAAFKGIEAFNKYKEKQYAELTTLNDAVEARRLIDDGVDPEDVKSVFEQTTGRQLEDEALKTAQKFRITTLESKAKNASRVLSNVVQNVPMSEVLQHPELFAAYPELANLPVSFATARSLGEGVAGAYRAGRPGAIDLLQDFGMVADRGAEGRSTMLHEGMHALQQREGFSPGTSEQAAQQAIAAGRLPPGTTPEQGYTGAAGEVEGRLVEARSDLSPEERAMFPPMSQESGDFGPAVPYGEQFVGQAGQPFGARSLSMGPAGSQRGAVLFGMGGEPQRPLRDLLADQPTTLRTLENLPGKRTELTVQEIQDQMRRPEVTREEKDVLNRVLERSAPGGRISAENLVREVGLETKDFSLTPQDTDRFADYGLQTIGRETGDYSYVTMGSATPNIEKVRTTVHRSPTPTSADNHFRDPNYFGHTRAFTADGIPHVVEIQSDLVQKAGKELSPAERTQLEQQVQSTTPQISLLDSVVPRNSRDVPEPEVLAANLRTVLPQLEALNPDARLFIGSELNSGWRFHDMGVSDVEVVDRALSMLTPNNPLRRDVAYDVFTSLNKFKDDLILQQAEASSKLAERGAATAQRPMFKNWERRLIREELSRAATPQVTPEYARLRKNAKDTIKQIKDAEAYYREQGLSEGEIASLTAGYKKDAEWYAKSAQETPQYLPTPSAVRFADADTVALVEGWPRKLEYTPGEARDYALEGKRLPGSSAGTANDWRYTGMVRMDENGIWEAERLPIDVDGRVIGAAKWSNSGTAQISEDIINRFVKPTDKFENAGHQGIYDRYKKEVTNYLKSLGAKPYKDSMGHSWWEVPVKPEQRRTQIFSMGGGAVAAGGAATYNGAEAEAQ